MTVGIATLAQNGTLVFAADRMLTRGATQTEPGRSKIYWWPDPIPHTVLWAGSAATYGEVIQMYRRTVGPHSRGKYPTIHSLVEAYSKCFSEMVGARAERDLLGRLGMTRQSLTSSGVPHDRAMALISQVFEYALPSDDDVHLILAGHDAHGVHIWTIHNEAPSCHDVECFASVGEGWEHADAQLRFAGFTSNRSAPEALTLAHFAKRRAESAPTVGRATDIRIGGADGIFSAIPEEWVASLDKTYDDFVIAERKSLERAIGEATSFMEEINRQMVANAVPTAAVTPVEGQQPPSESKHDQPSPPPSQASS
ncbi:MAG TPA: hypothetical protein VGM50_04555 [Gemmatimonadaceae bacterium]|jgi:hypothetical protein